MLLNVIDILKVGTCFKNATNINVCTNLVPSASPLRLDCHCLAGSPLPDNKGVDCNVVDEQ